MKLQHISRWLSVYYSNSEELKTGTILWWTEFAETLKGRVDGVTSVYSKDEDQLQVRHYNILMCGVLTLFTASYTDLITEMSFGARGKVIPVLELSRVADMKMEVTLCTFLASTVGVAHCLASHPSNFALCIEAHDTH